MIKHFLKLGFRNLIRNRRNTLTNLISLSLGIAILSVIVIMVDNELSVDSFHQGSSRIYKLSYGRSSGTPGPLAELLRANFPEIRKATHVETHQLFALTPVLEHKTELFDISGYYAADSAFFSVFDFKVLRGDVHEALNTPFSMILTESEAYRIFKNEDPMGKSIIWRTGQDYSFTIAAIVSDIPQNSSIRFRGLISEASTMVMTPYYPENWGFTVYETYLLLNPDIDPDQLENKLRSFLLAYYDSNLSALRCHDDARMHPLNLHSLKEVYFDQGLSNDSTNRGNMLQLRMLIVIGIVILLLSVINYSNLTTARASLRHQEVGVQKVYGASRTLLILQFLSETMMISFIALIPGLFLAMLLLPGLSQLLHYSHGLRIPASFLILVIPGTLVLGAITGIFPSFILASPGENSILKTGRGQRPGGKHLRNLLVGFQFIASITLISFTILIQRQITYLRQRDTGIEREQVLYAKLPRQLMGGKKQVLTERLQQLPDVVKLAYSSRIFGEMHGYDVLELKGRTVNFTSVWTDAGFIDLYDLQLLEGRFFREEMVADRNTTAVINETAAREFAAEDPFETEIRVPGGKAKVVGIVKDFNFKSLHHEIEPLAIVYFPGQGAFINIKISGNKPSETIGEIEEIWSELAPGFPFSYHFLDATFDGLYERDEQTGKAILYASMVAIIIAVLGVTSLSLFLCESRVKETAIRKINGARSREVVLVLNRSVVFSLLLATLLSVPLAWFLMRRWLDNFAYRSNIGIWIFIISGLIVSLIALSVVSWQSWRFANRNPADALRYE